MSDKCLAIIGASYLQLPLVEKAREMGFRTIGFAWEEGAVCRAILDCFYPISIVEKERILSICQEERIDGICTIASDVAAPTVAFVAEKLGLAGNTYQSALSANDKYLMRLAFSKVGVPCPGFQRVSSTKDINQVNLNYPVIVKPCDRSGSLGVIKVESQDKLENAVESALNYSFSHRAMIEEYVGGREISVEFISYQGKHYPLMITDKVTTGAPHFVELEHHQPASLTTDDYERVYHLTELALDALGVSDGASHTEYKITEDGKVYIIELGARMGGDFIGSDLVRLSTGYDFVRGVIEVATKQFTPPVKSIKQYSGVYFLSQETARLLRVFNRLEDYPEIVGAKRTDDVLRSITCSAERSGYLIYQSSHKVVL